jgi:hypothetical protein
MNMEMYSIHSFIDLVRDEDYLDVLRRAIAEGSAAEKAHRGKDRNLNQRQADYSRLLGVLVFFLQQGIRPAGITAEEFMLFRPLIKNLVGKGQLKAEIMQHFSGE